jgi:AmiR/NasT family two-component response regulator
MRSGMVRLGALNLYRDWPGPLTGAQHADALVLAEVAARWVLEAQAGAPTDTVAQELETGADFHFAVHNAAGIVSVQQDISITEALIRLRAYAFSRDRPLADVAADVVTRRLRLG